MPAQVTQDANPEQLLKLLEMQVALARERRAARDAGKGHAGTIGLFVIVAGAAFALWLLMGMLEQMRPAREDQAENSPAHSVEHRP